MTQLIDIYDHEFVDRASFVAGIIFCAILYFRRKDAQPSKSLSFASVRSAIDIATGAALFPAFVLAISIFDKKLLDNLIAYDRIVLSLAAAFAFFAVLEDAWTSAAKPTS